jgi:antitoxin (DNA-binding transcriptional repressor) of toxin-antitoxin stability system
VTVTTAETISASEFKATCLKILDRLAGHEVDRVVITKRGQPVGVLLPPDRVGVQDLYGAMRGSVVTPEGFDLTEPVLDEPIDAADGIWHR